MSKDNLQYCFLISPDVAVVFTPNTSYASASLPMGTTLSSLHHLTTLCIKPTAFVKPRGNALLGNCMLSSLLLVSFAQQLQKLADKDQQGSTDAA